MTQLRAIFANLFPLLTGIALTAAHARAADEPANDYAGAYPVSKSYTPPRDPQALAKLQQFQDLKFGFFMHWGIYSQWGIDASWSLVPQKMGWNARPDEYLKMSDRQYSKAYAGLAKTFNPVRFDPDKWADVAARAGTRYVIFTTKHHDGFCMWDTKTTEYKITGKNVPFAKNPRSNIVKEVFSAFRRNGARMVGTYFSKPDWNVPYYWKPKGHIDSRHPNYDTAADQKTWEKFRKFTWEQIDELMTDMGPVDILWLDGGWVKPKFGQDIDMRGIAKRARAKQPGLLVVDRTAGGGFEDYLTPEGSLKKIPEKFRPEPWEICITIARRGWGYTPDAEYREPAELIPGLVRIVARNGNMLLNTGVKPNGELPEGAVATYLKMGDWLRVNGDAIYETRPLIPYEQGDLYFTHKRDGRRFAILASGKPAPELPETIVLPAAVAEGSRSVKLLGSAEALGHERNPDGSVVVKIPATVRANPPCRFAWAFEMVK